jgi:hypothetical protein
VTCGPKSTGIWNFYSFQLKTLQDDGIVDMQSGKPFPKPVVSMNAYIGFVIISCQKLSKCFRNTDKKDINRYIWNTMLIYMA